MNDFTLVLNNLLRKPLRTILLVFSIFAAFLIFGVLGAFYKVYNAGVEIAAADRLLTINKVNFTQSIPISYVTRIRGVDGVKTSGGGLWFGGYYQDPKKLVQAFAIQDAKEYMASYPELIVPEGQFQAFLNTRDCLLVGQDIADTFGWKIGDQIPLNSNIWRKKNGEGVWQFNVCAIFDGTSKRVQANYVMFHYDYYNEAVSRGKDGVNWIILTTDDPALNEQVSKEIDALFVNSRAETKTATEAVFVKGYMQQVGSIGKILTYVIGSSFATILIIVGTTITMAVAGRTREFAILKTLGFRAGRIFRIVLAESLLLSLFGGMMGMALATVVLLMVRNKTAEFLPGWTVSLDVAGVGIGLMIALGLATGFLPAYNAMRIQIVTALGKN